MPSGSFILSGIDAKLHLCCCFFTTQVCPLELQGEAGETEIEAGFLLLTPTL
jgi:hypothetical protein